MEISKIPTTIFMRIYKKFPHQFQQRLLTVLLRLEILPSSIKNRVIYYGIFRVKVNSTAEFKMINYGGTIEQAVFRDGLSSTWEGDVIWIWKDLCKISQVVFDIGANTGIYALIARSIRRDNQVYAFEPSPRIFKKLQNNNDLNCYNLLLERLAVSNKTGSSFLYDTLKNNETAASLSRDKLKDAPWYKGKVIEYKVLTIKLSDYIEKHSIPRLDLLKLDIEMHEVEALEGLGKYLDLFRPVMLIEVLTIEMADKLNSFFELSKYEIFHLKSSAKAQAVQEFQMFPLVYETHEWNYLVFHKSLKEKIAHKTSLYKNLISGE